MRRRSAGTLCLLLLGAVTAMGCGGEELSKEDYTTQVRDAIQPVVETSQNLATDAQGAMAVEDLSEPLGEAESTYSETASTLEEIDPPDDVEDLHERLVTAHEDIAEAAGDAADAAAEGDETGVMPFQEAGMAYQEELTALETDYQEQEYDFGAAAMP